MSSAVYIDLTLNAVLLQTNLCCHLIENILNQNISIFSFVLLAYFFTQPSFVIATVSHNVIGQSSKKMFKGEDLENFYIWIFFNRNILVLNTLTSNRKKGESSFIYRRSEGLGVNISQRPFPL